MSDAQQPPPIRRRLKKRWLGAAGAALALSGIGIAIGPGAPWLIDHVSNGQRIGRVGRLRLEGVTGSWLGDLHVRRAALADERGEWVEAEDLSVRWRPFDLLIGAQTHIEVAHAAHIALLRQPALSEAHPPHNVKFHVDIDALRVDRLNVAKDAFGAPGVFAATGALELSSEVLSAIDLDLRRLDSDADHAVVHYRDEGPYTLHIDVVSAARSGVLAHALGLADQELRIAGDGVGRNGSGEARVAANIGSNELASAAWRWTTTQWSLQGGGRFDLLAQTRELQGRFGDTVALSGQGVRSGAFTLHAQSPQLTLDLAGMLDEEWKLAGPARVIAQTPHLSAIAHEQPFEFGAARFEGELSVEADTYDARGQLDARDLDVLGRRAHLAGFTHARLTPDRFSLDADLRAPEGQPALFANTRLETNMAYDRDRGRYTLDHTRLSGDAVDVDAHGWANGGDGEFSGEWRLKQLAALFDGLGGEAGGRWRAFATPAGQRRFVWSTTMDGAGVNIAGAPEIAPQLLGRAPRLDALFRFEDTKIAVDHIRLNGEQLRAASTGRIVHGDAQLQVEASARGPLSIGDAHIAGAVDITGRLTGQIARPTLTAHAALANFSAGGIDVVQPIVDFTLAPSRQAYHGQVQLRGAISGQPVAATSSVAIADSSLSLPGLAAHIGGLEARGKARFTPQGASAQLSLEGAIDGLIQGVTGRVLGHAALTPETLNLDAQIAEAQAGELHVRAATISATGPYRAIAVRYNLRGALRRAPLAFAGTATISAANGGADARLEGQGALAGAAIATRTPIIAHWRESGMDAALDMTLADGAVRANWRERGRVLQGAATIGEAPVAPLAAIWGERATGRIGGDATLVNTGGGLSGDAHVRLTDVRFAGRQRGALSGAFTAHLDPSRLTAQIDATSTDGLVAHFQADAPVSTSASPIRIALARERRGRATWSVHGPAGALWNVARFEDQDLDGDLDGEGTLSFGAGSLSGAGRIAIAHGSFEDKVSGVKLENLEAAVGISEHGVTIERFAADDSRGGHVTATGGSTDPEHGRIAVDFHELRLVDRPDARLRASGQLAFAWQGTAAQLTGALAASEGDVSLAQNPQAGIPTLDVVEINRPEEDVIAEEPQHRAALGATQLDIRLTAPGRIFTRGRGVDAEWSLDLKLGGTSEAPLIYGQARALRGTISLSGQPFDIDDGTIFFNGAVREARINLTATRDTADLSAHMLLTGTAADPELSFTSTPALPEDEILPQILFGHSVEDLNALEAAQLAASLASLSGQASFNLVDAARAATGLDRFSVREDAAGGLLVAGGVYLTRGVYVELGRTSLGQASTRVEWTIRPRLVLVTSFLTNGDQRASIRWRRESN